MTKRIERIIKILKLKIDNLHKLSNETNDELLSNIYINEASSLHSCIWLLTDDNYLENIEKIYFEE